MDWLTDLLDYEESLKREIAALKKAEERDLSCLPKADHFDKSIKHRIEEIQAILDDYLCGRNEAERYVMRYKVRLNLPIFSHLRSMYSIQSPIRN